MSFSFVLFLMALPVLAICALAMYLGMSGIEDEKKARISNRKAIENELIQNGLWRIVGADVATLDKAIRFLLEDQRARARMSDETRMKKLTLLREYRNTFLREPRREDKYLTTSLEDWNDWIHSSLSFSFWPTNKFYSPTRDPFDSKS